MGRLLAAALVALLGACDAAPGPLEIFIEGAPTAEDMHQIELGLWLLGADYELVGTPGRGVVTWEHMPSCIEAESLGVDLPDELEAGFRACGYVLGELGHGTGCERRAAGIAHPTVVAHELGHVFGAGHAAAVDDIMYADGHIESRSAKMHMDQRDVVLQRVEGFVEDCT